jgi:hypothetical protein
MVDWQPPRIYLPHHHKKNAVPLEETRPARRNAAFGKRHAASTKRIDQQQEKSTNSPFTWHPTQQWKNTRPVEEKNDQNQGNTQPQWDDAPSTKGTPNLSTRAAENFFSSFQLIMKSTSDKSPRITMPTTRK